MHPVQLSGADSGTRSIGNDLIYRLVHPHAQRFSEVPRLTTAQREVLDLIDSIANERAFYLDMDFEPGDIQFLKNAVILHARTEYEDWEEPERKRHLLRLWLTNPALKDGDAQIRQGIRVGKAA